MGTTRVEHPCHLNERARATMAGCWLTHRYSPWHAEDRCFWYPGYLACLVPCLLATSTVCMRPTPCGVERRRCCSKLLRGNVSATTSTVMTAAFRVTLLPAEWWALWASAHAVHTKMTHCLYSWSSAYGLSDRVDLLHSGYQAAVTAAACVCTVHAAFWQDACMPIGPIRTQCLLLTFDSHHMWWVTEVVLLRPLPSVADAAPVSCVHGCLCYHLHTHTSPPTQC